jgi:hypothetical protein
MKVAMRRGGLLMSVLAVALVLTACGGVNRRDYVAGNEAILNSLPAFPGAVKAHEVSTPDDRSEGGLSTRPNSYLTTVVYRVPRGTRGASVIRFYQTQLQRRGWERSKPPRVADFTRGEAFVAVNAAFLMPAHGQPIDWMYELLVDHRGARR